MLLRRVTEHFKAQNWVAVFLDFLIVVSGVFIGIQVANWNDIRLERGREKDALSELLREMEDNISYTEWIMSEGEVRQRHRDAAIAKLHGNELSEGDPDKGLLLLAPVRDLTPISGTYDELTASGDIALVEDATVRRALALVQGVNRYNDRRREDAMEAMPDIEAVAAPYLTFMPDPAAPGGRSVTVDWAGASGDMQVRRAALSANAIQQEWEDRWQAIQNQTVAACLLIAAELEERCQPEDWVSARERGENVDDDAYPLERIDAFLRDWRARNKRDNP